MIKILNIVGARPQIIKAAALSRAIRTHYSSDIEEIIIHTGQHYDYNMSQVFFEELKIPVPHINMDVKSDTHARQTAQIMIKTEEIIMTEKPDAIVVYGDTNSTLAVSIASAKLHFPVVHIEAGLRSYNKMMPEEINRITCDHVSTVLFTPTQTAMQNLNKEGFNIEAKPKFNIDNPGVFMSGDIMYDNALYYKKDSKRHKILEEIHGDFALVTIHREQNTDNLENLKRILLLLIQIADEQKINIVFPIHPRTVKVMWMYLTELKEILDKHMLIHIIEPVSYLEILFLLKECKFVITDSGGLQKESYFMQKPCIILRTETEWLEILEHGVGKVTGLDALKVNEAVEYFMQYSSELQYPPIFGDGKASEYICQKMIEIFN